MSHVSKQEQVHESCSYLWFWNKIKTRTHFYKHKAWHFSQLMKRNTATLNLNILFYTSYYSVMYAKGSQNPLTSNIHMWIVLMSCLCLFPDRWLFIFDALFVVRLHYSKSQYIQTFRKSISNLSATTQATIRQHFKTLDFKLNFVES